MATSLLITCDNNSNTSSLITSSEDHGHQPARRGGGRRKKAGNDQKKKQPQRGMGVAQLERIRKQELDMRSWKKLAAMNETVPISNQPLMNVPASFADHPAMISNAAAAAMVSSSLTPPPSPFGGYVGGAVWQMGLSRNQGFCGFQAQVGNGGLVSTADQFQVNPFRVMGSDPGFRSKNVVMGTENSKELSSMPNVVKCYYEHCDVCHKKKRVNGENLRCGKVRSEMDMQMLSSMDIRDCSFLGLSFDDKKNVSHRSLASKAPSPVLFGGYAVSNAKPGVEVVTVHRKGSSSSGVLMEYEFFPGSANSELVMMKLESSSPSFSSSGTATTGFDASTSVDLSLKLSY